MNRLNILGLAVLGLFLSACTSGVTSQVVRFHNLGAPQGQLVVVQPAPEGRDGPEFRTYADQVIGHLKALGYQPAAGETPDFIVQLSYGVEERESRYRYSQWHRPFYFGFAYGNPYRPRRVFDHFYWDYYLHYPPEFYETPRYAKMLEMVITDKMGEIVFEGRAVSQGASSNLPRIMPYLVDALFTGFPGESGKTIRVNIQREDPRDNGTY